MKDPDNLLILEISLLKKVKLSKFPKLSFSYYIKGRNGITSCEGIKNGKAFAFSLPKAFAIPFAIGIEWNAATARTTTCVNWFYSDPTISLPGAMKGVENDPGIDLFMITWS